MQNENEYVLEGFFFFFFIIMKSFFWGGWGVEGELTKIIPYLKFLSKRKRRGRDWKNQG